MLNKQLHTQMSHNPGFLISESFKEAEFKGIRLKLVNKLIEGHAYDEKAGATHSPELWLSLSSINF
jgi:hypothetical protein